MLFAGNGCFIDRLLVKRGRSSTRSCSMAKIKRRRLKWDASSSSQIVGYKLYWSENGALNYDSQWVMLGNITEIVLPDDVKSFTPNGGPIEFGVTAVDELGNESDMITLTAPYQFNVPKAPDDLYLQKLEDFYITNDRDDKVDYYITDLEGDDSDETEPIQLVEAVDAIKRGKSRQPQNDFETADKIRRAAGKV
jgi:hypothetical protein